MKKTLSIIMILGLVFAFGACATKEYKDEEVTAVVTNAEGETVTDKAGKPVTEIVSQSKKTTTTNAIGKTTTGNSDKTASNTSGGSTAATSKNSKTTTKKTTTSTTKNNTSKTTTKKPTTTTTVPDNRVIKITVQLPHGSNEKDTIIISVNGKEVKKDTVSLNGSTYTFTTKDKYRGEVKVRAELKNNGKSENAVVKKGKAQVLIDLMGIEIVAGEND